MSNPDLRTILDNVLLTLQNAVVTIKQCNDVEIGAYLKRVDDALIEKVIEEIEEVRSYLPIGGED